MWTTEGPQHDTELFHAFSSTNDHNYSQEVHLSRLQSFFPKIDQNQLLKEDWTGLLQNGPDGSVQHAGGLLDWGVLPEIEASFTWALGLTSEGTNYETSASEQSPAVRIFYCRGYRTSRAN